MSFVNINCLYTGLFQLYVLILCTISAITFVVCDAISWLCQLLVIAKSNCYYNLNLFHFRRCLQKLWLLNAKLPFSIFLPRQLWASGVVCHCLLFISWHVFYWFTSMHRFMFSMLAAIAYVYLPTWARHGWSSLSLCYTCIFCLGYQIFCCKRDPSPKSKAYLIHSVLFLQIC